VNVTGIFFAMSENIQPFSDLTKPETFDPGIFAGDQHMPQDVCSFILALACIYNDYKDILMAFYYLDYLQPSFPVKETAVWGEYNGLKFHLIRLHASLVHELLDLIKRSHNVLNNPCFRSITNQLDILGKSTWDALIEASSENASTDIGKTFLMIRNKISFHYDPKEFFQGYTNWFLNRNSVKRPYVSRGKQIRDERYYFAEASAQSYFEKVCTDKSVNTDQIFELATSLGPAISQIVKSFIDTRRLGRDI
jgi:hypothetical protein